MKIAVCCDHGGLDLKTAVVSFLKETKSSTSAPIPMPLAIIPTSR